MIEKRVGNLVYKDGAWVDWDGYRYDTLHDAAVAELRRVAEFIDRNADALVGDIDSTFITEDGISFAFDLLPYNSIGTLMVSKEHLIMERYGASGNLLRPNE